MNIKETFLNLTLQTYPDGTEYEVFDKLPKALQSDEFNNLFIKIGDSDVMFTSHLDTATHIYTKVNHVIDGNIIRTDGTTILGADDKAGVTIMLYMIEKNVPGLYYFFLGEEVGCVGSRKLSEKHKIEKLPYINKVVSFDRRDTGSVITFQGSMRCCSDAFAIELSKRFNLVEPTFNYEDDPTGMYTDSAQFTDIYPECTNISVGYSGEHTFHEFQDIDHLEKLAEACVKIDWVSLPVERDPSFDEYIDYDYFGRKPQPNASYKTYDDWDDYYKNMSNEYENEMIEVTYFMDKKYNYASDFTMGFSSKEYMKVNISDARFDEERELIFKFIESFQLDYTSMKWDGLNLTLRYGKDVTNTTRRQLMEYVPELDLHKLSKFKAKDIKLKNKKHLSL